MALFSFAKENQRTPLETTFPAIYLPTKREERAN